MGQCGINILGRGRKLYINYRTTDEIRNYALGILTGREIDDLDGGIDENKRYKSLSHGPKPRIEKTADLESASNLIPKILKDWGTDYKQDFFPKTCVMASKNKIAWVHFRNVKGQLPRFTEVFHDEGEVDMRRAMEVYKDNGFNGPYGMDHTPTFPQERAGWAGKAYANGYIRALIQTVYG